MDLYVKKMDPQDATLAWKFHVCPNSCDNPSHYEYYLRLNAISENASGKSVTHILLDCNSDRIAGFVSLRASSLVDVCDGVSFGTPVMEIAELAVDQEYEHCGIGTKLVQLALVLAEKLNESFMGIRYVMLCADPRAVNFYSRNDLGFGRVEDHYNVPRDGWNKNCIPMYLKIAKD